MARFLLLAAFLAALTGGAAAAGKGHHGPSAAADCPPDDGALRCATAASPALGPDGALWLAWVAGGRVWTARTPAGDPAGALGAPVDVSGAPARVDANGDGRPSLVVDASGRATVAWSHRRGQAYNGQVLLAASADGGRTFSPPAPLVADGVSERFPVLLADPGRGLFAAWIDKRAAAAAAAAGREHAGASLLGAWSTDGGATFGPSFVIGANSCECCRVALAAGPDGRPALAWRGIFPGGIRDHAVMSLGSDGAPGPVRRLADDGWAIDACPHHGPALAAGAGALHAAWYTEGRHRQGLFYARSGDGGESFTDPLPFGAPDRLPSHPHVTASGETVWLAWKEFDGSRTRILVQVSRDGGTSWGAPRAAAETADDSDHPVLLVHAGTAYLSWLSRAEGWRLFPLSP